MVTEAEIRAVCILGMHRSGTSNLAGCLEEAGLNLGVVHTANPWNLKGNRESQEIMDLHDDVLAANGGSWDWPPESVRWSPEHKRRLERIVAQRSGTEPWGFKDPRTILTVDGWLEVIPELNFVGTFRHPITVAASLQRRDPAIETQHALDLWLHHNTILIELHDAHRFPIVEFGVYAPAYLAAVQDIAFDLGLHPPSTGFTFYEAELHHADGQGPVEQSVQSVYDELCARSI